MPDPIPHWILRTPADLTSLLLELARALRGLAFYPETDPSRDPLVDRAHRAVENELSRAGPIDLRIDDEGFHISGLHHPVPSTGVIADLSDALSRHQVQRIRLDPILSRHALHGLLELLSHPHGRHETPWEFARALSAREASGIQLNELDIVSEPIQRKLSTTPRCASASLGSAILARRSDDPTSQLEVVGPFEEKPTLEADPLRAVSPDDRGERLRARLIELDQTLDDDTYELRAQEIVRWAEDLWVEGLTDDCYRTLLVFADHAVGCGGRSGSQARSAAAFLAELAQAERMDDLIRRACARPAEAGVRAAQLLLQLGRRAVPAIFQEICRAQSLDDAAPLQSLILALGEESLPTLVSAIESPDDRCAAIAIRLVGELQSPAVLPVLVRALSAKELGRRLETIRALSLLPGKASKAALERALDSDLDEIVVAAMSALAKNDGSSALPTLLDVLEASVHTGRTPVCVGLIDVLARIGDERAVPRLAAILERRPRLRRAHWHAIQLAAVDAIATLPTKEARRSLERTATHGDRPVRSRAQKHVEGFFDDD